MVTYSRAEASHYKLFMQLMRKHGADYLERSLLLMDMTWEAFSELFVTVGQVCGIYEDGCLAGFYWIEKRGAVLHLYGLILKEGFREQGIGTQVLHDLEARHGEGTHTFELGVHQSNRRAKRLYRRLGYRRGQTLEDLGFEIMQKQVSEAGSTRLGGRAQ